MNDKNNKRKDIHTVSMLVANKPGVLVRCAQVFARRGFNIDALVVSASVNPKFSRMTITAQGDPGTLDQIIKQTSKLIDVIHCGEHTRTDSIDREYALIKVKSGSPSSQRSLPEKRPSASCLKPARTSWMKVTARRSSARPARPKSWTPSKKR